MSKIIVEFDTKEQAMSVKVDGKEVSDVYDVSFYRYEDYNDKEKITVGIGIRKEPENEGDLCTYTRLVASENGEMTETQDDAKPVHGDIAKLLEKYR